MPIYPDLLKQTTVNISESALDLSHIWINWLAWEADFFIWSGEENRQVQLYLMMTPWRTVRRIVDQTPPLIKCLSHILTMP